MKKLLFIVLFIISFSCSKDTETVTEIVEVYPELKNVTVKYTAICQSCTSFIVNYVDAEGNKKVSTGANAIWNFEFETLEGSPLFVSIQTNESTAFISTSITYTSSFTDGNNLVSSNLYSPKPTDFTYSIAITPLYR